VVAVHHSKVPLGVGRVGEIIGPCLAPAAASQKMARKGGTLQLQLGLLRVLCDLRVLRGELFFARFGLLQAFAHLLNQIIELLMTDALIDHQRQNPAGHIHCDGIAIEPGIR